MNILEDLKDAPRLLIDIELKPVQGSRFQPTGFPDIGPAQYTGAEGEQMLLVESAQSMANRLEAVIWDEVRQDLISPLVGIPYVKVTDSHQNFLTCSILEAHRLNSVYIENGATEGGKKGDFHATLSEEMGYDKKNPGMINNAKVAKALFKYDPNSLIHGCFMESIAGRIRVPRALTAFIEADKVQRAASGGVKNDNVQPEKAEGATAKEGFGNVPFHRDEFAGKVKVYFNLDLAQIRGYRLSEEAQQFLVTLSLLKIRLFLEQGLRLRTACDLEETGEGWTIRTTGPGKVERIPEKKDLWDSMPALVKNCQGEFASPAITEVTFAK